MTTGTDRDAGNKPEVVLIVAMARNRVIGRDGTLPWHLPEDLKRFRQLTMGHPIIMGRKTWDSIGRPLPGRRNIVVSRNPGLALEGAETAASVEDALKLTADADTVFVIGGEQIYRAALPLADRIELTLIDADVEGDTSFPEIKPDEWMETSHESRREGDGPFPYSFTTLKKAP